ncbi:hypothetical protein HK102_011114 [Quaeritorhiza haematococci]|nr:hypothetical protein HK102_011114 [Quaeritorhiza haematococci]
MNPVGGVSENAPARVTPSSQLPPSSPVGNRVGLAIAPAREPQTSVADSNIKNKMKKKTPLPGLPPKKLSPKRVTAPASAATSSALTFATGVPTPDKDERSKLFGIDCAEVVHFTMWEPGGEYTKNLIVKNVFMKTLKIKYKLPKTRYFSMNFPETVTLSAGMSWTIPIVFRPVAKENYNDFIEFTASSGKFNMPIMATLPEHDLEFPKRIDLGYSPARETTKKTFTLRNVGELSTNFEWDLPAPDTASSGTAAPLTISPLSGLLHPGASTTITLAFLPTDASVYTASIICHFGDKSSPATWSNSKMSKPLTVHAIGKFSHLAIATTPNAATTVASTTDNDVTKDTNGSGSSLAISVSESTSALKNMNEYTYDSDEPVVFDFGDVFIGRSVEKTFLLHNPSPVHANFKIRRAQSSSGSSSSHDADAIASTTYFHFSKTEGAVGTGKKSKITFALEPAAAFRIDKLSGTVPPQSSIPMTIRFVPAEPINYYRRIYCLVEHEDAIYLDVLGSCYNDRRRPPSFTYQHLESYWRRAKEGLWTFGPEQLEEMLKAKLIRYVDGALSYAKPKTTTNAVVATSGGDPSICNEYFFGLVVPARWTPPQPSNTSNSGDASPTAKTGVITTTASTSSSKPLVGPSGVPAPVTILDEYVDFGSCSRLRVIESRVVRIVNNTKGKVTAVWVVPPMASTAPAAGGAKSGGGTTAAANGGAGGGSGGANGTEAVEMGVANERANSIFSITPRTQDILPLSTATFQVNFRPAADNVVYGVEMECFVYAKSMRNFRLVTEEIFTPCWCLKSGVVGNTFEPGADNFIPKITFTTDPPPTLTLTTTHQPPPASAPVGSPGRMSVATNAAPLAATTTSPSTVSAPPRHWLDFPCCHVDCAVYRTVRVTNTGDTPVKFTFVYVEAGSGVDGMARSPSRSPPKNGIGIGNVTISGSGDSGAMGSGGGFSGESGGVFSVKPRLGVLNKNEARLLVFRFSPAEARVYRGVVKAIFNGSVANGVDIHIRGQGTYPAITFAPSINTSIAVQAVGAKGSASGDLGGTSTVLFFKPTCVGATSVKQLWVRNTSKVFVEFEWRIPKSYKHLVRITPTSGRLAPNSITPLVCRFAPSVARVWSMRVPCYYGWSGWGCGVGAGVGASGKSRRADVSEGSADNAPLPAVTPSSPGGKDVVVDVGGDGEESTGKDVGAAGKSKDRRVSLLMIGKGTEGHMEALPSRPSKARLSANGGNVSDGVRIGSSVAEMGSTLGTPAKVGMSNSMLRDAPPVEVAKVKQSAKGPSGANAVVEEKDDKGTQGKDKGVNAVASVGAVTGGIDGVGTMKKRKRNDGDEAGDGFEVLEENDELFILQPCGCIPARAQQILKFKVCLREQKNYVFRVFYRVEAPDSMKPWSNDTGSLIRPHKAKILRKHLCDISAIGVHRSVQVVDIRCDGFAKGYLWHSFSLRRFNEVLEAVSPDSRIILDGPHSPANKANMNSNHEAGINDVKDGTFNGNQVRTSKRRKSGQEDMFDRSAPGSALPNSVHSRTNAADGPIDATQGRMSGVVSSRKASFASTSSSVDFDFGAKPVGNKPTVVHLNMVNTGVIPLEWVFHFPNDLQIEMESWADPGDYTEEQLHYNMIIENKLFVIEPKSGYLEPGESVHIVMSYSHDKAGSHRLPVIFKIKDGLLSAGHVRHVPSASSDGRGGARSKPSKKSTSQRGSSSKGGKEVLITFIGYTVPPAKKYLHFHHSHEHAFLPVSIGTQEPPIQLFPLWNRGTVSLQYKLNLSPVERLHQANHQVEIFKCNKSSGSINPGEVDYIEWIFHPHETKSYEVSIPITIVDSGGGASHGGGSAGTGGKTTIITFRGEGIPDMKGSVNGDSGKQASGTMTLSPFYKIPPVQVIYPSGQLACLSLERVDFGHIPLDAVLRQVVCVRNMTANDEISFDWVIPDVWDSASKNRLTITPRNGLLGPGESRLVKIIFVPKYRPQLFDLDILCYITNETEKTTYEAEREAAIIAKRENRPLSGGNDPPHPPKSRDRSARRSSSSPSSPTKSSQVGVSSRRTAGGVLGDKLTKTPSQHDLKTIKYKALPPISTPPKTPSSSAPQQPPVTPPSAATVSVGGVVPISDSAKVAGGDGAHARSSARPFRDGRLSSMSIASDISSLSNFPFPRPTPMPLFLTILAQSHPVDEYRRSFGDTGEFFQEQITAFETLDEEHEFFTKESHKETIRQVLASLLDEIVQDPDVQRLVDVMPTVPYFAQISTREGKNGITMEAQQLQQQPETTPVGLEVGEETTEMADGIEAEGQEAGVVVVVHPPDAHHVDGELSGSERIVKAGDPGTTIDSSGAISGHPSLATSQKNLASESIGARESDNEAGRFGQETQDKAKEVGVDPEIEEEFLRSAEFQNLVEMVLEGTIYNLMQEANCDEFDPTQEMKRVYKPA